jgi:nicotinate-nucleotide adenylyltransferase
MERVGVLGGTFDPVHVGHVLLAIHLRERLPLDHVVFVPAAVPPHKAPRPDMATAADRWEMVRRAVGPVEGLGASRTELDRSGPSYTADTLCRMGAEHPDWQLFLLIGDDNIGQIASWHRPDLIVAHCTVVAGTRCGPGSVPGSQDRWASRVLRVPTPAFDVSSTEIRARVRAGRPIMHLVPEPVEQFIREHGLYGAAGVAVDGPAAGVGSAATAAAAAPGVGAAAGATAVAASRCLPVP